MEQKRKINFKYCAFDNNLHKFKQCCYLFASKIQDDSIREKLYDIICDGKTGNYTLDTDLCNQGDRVIEICRRVAIGYLITTYPETFNVLQKYNANIFHGSNLSALPSILQNGMKNFDELTKSGIEVNTGETYSRRFGRNFISLTDDLSIAMNYAGHEINGMILCFSQDDIKDMNFGDIRSDVVEMGIKNDISIDKIKAICVTPEKLKFVRKLIGERPIEILPMDLCCQASYRSYQALEYFDQRIDEIKNSQKNKGFGIKDLKELTTSMKISNIKNMYNKLKDKILSKNNKRNEIENYER